MQSNASDANRRSGISRRSFLGNAAFAAAGLATASVFGVSCASEPEAPATQPTSSGSGGGDSAPAGTSSGSSAQSSSAPAKIEKVNVSVSNAIWSFAPLYVALAKNTFADYGLDVELTLFNSGSQQVQGVLSKSVDIGHGAMTDVFSMSITGALAPGFLFIYDALSYDLIADKGITDISQLEGKTVGISKAGSLTDTVVSMVLGHEGLPQDFVKRQQSGSSTERWAALKSGAIDATLLDLPTNVLAKDAGYVSVADVGAMFAGYPYEVAFARKDLMDANPDLYTRYARGYVDGVKYMKDPANKDEVLTIASDRIGLSKDDLEIAYAQTLDLFPDDGMPTREGIELALSQTKEFGTVEGIDKLTVDDLYYPQIAEAAATA